MPVLQRDDVEIHYEEHGAGFPVLTLAPGGMRSAGDWWAKMPWNPVAELAGDYRVITMDQRNAGSSRAPVTGDEGWSTYAQDQLAVLDHLGVERCHVVGMCIGGAFIARLLTSAPQRFARAVALQPIGLDGNRDAFHEMFDGWAAELAGDHPEAGPDAWARYRANLYDGDNALFSVPESVLPTITTPLLVLRGDDIYHPRSASELMAASVPGARLIERWKDPEHLPAAASAIAEFLAAG
ncbi:MAG: alpha/beta hydrolase [Actinomycetota bacterium]|nr:alpha/beta hydrolase [Actinomycetota bacterium]